MTTRHLGPIKNYQNRLFNFRKYCLMTQMCFVAEKNSGQGQCHMHSKTARRKHEKRETLHCMFSHLPIHCVILASQCSTWSP